MLFIATNLIKLVQLVYSVFSTNDIIYIVFVCVFMVWHSNKFKIYLY